MTAPIAYGSALLPGRGPVLCARVGASQDTVLDLGAIAQERADDLLDVLDRPNLDALLAAGADRWDTVNAKVAAWSEDEQVIAQYATPLGVALDLPFTVADYVDFFSSREHAENLGRILRPGQAALQPNWLSLPVGYHGRAGTVIVSDTPVVRPSGQLPDGNGSSVFGPTRKLDVEVEVGFVVGGIHPPGVPVPASSFARTVFGVVLVNDWSARDIQAFEYVPLGPMLAKSFATSISAWVFPLSAFSSARIAPPSRERPLHPYLEVREDWGLDIDLRLAINGTEVSAPQFRDMYWTPDQQLAHMTVNGARARAGDLFASGTVSSSDPRGYGSLIELTRNGQEPLHLNDGSRRMFLEDGDEVQITATAPAPDGGRFCLGEVKGRILPAIPDPMEEES